MDYGLPEISDQTETFNIEESDGSVYGISRKDTYFIDVNHDGKKDKLIRGRFSNMTAHGYTFYEIYLHDGTKIDFPDFRTVEGADCFLQSYKFRIKPFEITKVSRPMGQDWTDPTNALVERYIIFNKRAEREFIMKTHKPVCDVRALL